MKVRCELRNTEPSAVEATRSTLAMPPLSATLIQEGDAFFIDGSDFAVWAAEHQGYVKKVLRERP